MQSWRHVLMPLLRLRPYEVELLRPAHRVSPLAWIVFAAGAFAIVASAIACKPAWDRHAQLALRRAEIQSELARFGVGASLADSGSKGRIEKNEAIALIAELQRPWHDLFDQIETADDKDVHIVQLSIEPHFTSLQLVAEARDLDKLVRFAQRLGRVGPVRGMTMTHHEWHDVLGAHVVRASMQGELAPLWPAPTTIEAKR